MTLIQGVAARAGLLARRHAAIAAVALVALAFGAGGAAAQAEKEVRFGASLSLTGGKATEGRLVKDGYDFMVRHINKAGGIPIGNDKYKVSIVYYDDESDANTAVKLVEKLIVEDKVNLLLGPYSSAVTLPASAVSEKYQVPMVIAHGAATALFERGYKYLFATLTTIDQYFGNIVQMASELSPRPQTVALITEDSLAPQLSVTAAAKRAADLGLEVVYRDSYPTGSKDWSTMLAAVRSKNPDMVLAAGYTGDMIPLARQAKEMGVQPKLFGFMLGPTLPGFKEALGADSNYLLEPVQWSKTMGWKDQVFGWSSQDYARMFKEEFGYEPDYHPPQSSAALMVYYHALGKAGGLDPQKVRDAIAATDIMTFYGPVRFDEAGRNIAKGMAVVQIQDLQPVVVYPAKVAEGKLVYPRPKP